MEIDVDWTEKLPLPFMILLFKQMFRLSAHHCLCHRPLLIDVRNQQMADLQRVCTVWWRRWKQFAIYLALSAEPFCDAPGACSMVYAYAAPKLPIMRRRTPYQDRIHPAQRTYKNGRVEVRRKSFSAEQPGEGTEN